MSEICTVIANGPSLRIVPLEFLEKYPTFGTNGIFLLRRFQATYYVAFDKDFIAHNYVEVEAYVDKVEHSYIRQGLVRERDSVTPIYRIDREMPVPGAMGIRPGGSVTTIALELAIKAGFKKILLVGLDHNYFQASYPLPHFHPEYYNPMGRVVDMTPAYWHGLKMRVEYSFDRILKEFQKTGGEIINLTKESLCEVFPKEDLDAYTSASPV